MTNGYSRRTTELQRPETLRAGVPGNASRLMARKTHRVIRSQTSSSKAEASKEHTVRERAAKKAYHEKRLLKGVN